MRTILKEMPLWLQVPTGRVEEAYQNRFIKATELLEHEDGDLRKRARAFILTMSNMDAGFMDLVAIDRNHPQLRVMLDAFKSLDKYYFGIWIDRMDKEYKETGTNMLIEAFEDVKEMFAKLDRADAPKKGGE